MYSPEERRMLKSRTRGFRFWNAFFFFSLEWKHFAPPCIRIAFEIRSTNGFVMWTQRQYMRTKRYTYKILTERVRCRSGGASVSVRIRFSSSSFVNSVAVSRCGTHTIRFGSFFFFFFYLFLDSECSEKRTTGFNVSTRVHFIFLPETTITSSTLRSDLCTRITPTFWWYLWFARYFARSFHEILSNLKVTVKNYPKNG